MITRGFEFSADEAERVGLINHVFDEEVFEEEVAAFVSSYARTSRSAVMLTKKLLYQMDGMTFDAALETGAEVNAIARLTADCKAGIGKFLERRTEN